MYQFSYAETEQESFAPPRNREPDAFDRSLDALRRAEAAGPPPRQAIEAIHLTRSRWSILVEDLASPENQLPAEPRGSLISIGLWNMSRSDQILRGDASGFEPLIYVNTLIRDGLQ